MLTRVEQSTTSLTHGGDDLSVQRIGVVADATPKGCVEDDIVAAKAPPGRVQDASFHEVDVAAAYIIMHSLVN